MHRYKNVLFLLTAIAVIGLGTSILFRLRQTPSKGPHNKSTEEKADSEGPPNNIGSNLSAQYIYEFPGLQLSFSYPQEWGPAGNTSKREKSSCAYVANFLNRPVNMCAFSLAEIGYLTDAQPGVSKSEISEEFKGDKKEIETKSRRCSTMISDQIEKCMSFTRMNIE